MARTSTSKARILRGSIGLVSVVGSLTLVTGTASASPSVTRYQGADRFATSAAIVDASYGPGVPVVYIATGLNFPDALAGGAAAANGGGPLLLVQPDTIPAPVVTELQRLKPGRIVVLGGVRAVSAAVASALQGFTTGTVTRVAGADRYQTAATLAASFASGSPVYLATGVNFPDALAATAAAASKHAAILLTDPVSLPPATAQALSSLKPSSVTIVGASGAVSAAVEQQLALYSGSVTRISGADRYATAAAIAASAFPSATGVYIAAAGGFADALTGGPVAGKSGQPLLLAAPTCLPDATATEVAAIAPTSVTLLGGTAALGAGVASLTTCPAAPVIGTPAGTPYFTFSATMTEGGTGTGYNAYINAHDANNNALSVGIQTDKFAPETHGLTYYTWERVQAGVFTYGYIAPASNGNEPITMKWWSGSDTAVFYAGSTAIASIPVHMTPRLFFGIEGDARISGDTVNDTFTDVQIDAGNSCPAYCGLNGAWNTSSFNFYGLTARNTNGQPQNGANFTVTGKVTGLAAPGDWDSNVVAGIGMIAQRWNGA